MFEFRSNYFALLRVAAFLPYTERRAELNFFFRKTFLTAVAAAAI